MPILNCPIRAHTISTPDSVAIHLSQNKITFAQLDRMISNRANELKQYDIGINDAVAFCGDNSLSLVVSLFAIIRLGAIFCPLNKGYTHAEKQKLLLQTGIKYLWQEQGISIEKAHIEGVMSLNLNDDLLNNKVQNYHSNVGKPFNHIAIGGALPATIIFTSGSTGQPKAAVHSLNNHYYSALGSQSVVPIVKTDCWLASLPINHIGGLAILMRCFIAGASIALVDRKNLLESFLKYPITHASLVPTQLYRLLQQYRLFQQESPTNTDEGLPKNSLKLKYLLLGGAPINQQLLAQTSVLGVNTFYSYGLTEMSSQVATISAEKHFFSHPLPYREWKLVDSEIVICGKALFLGYMVNGKIQSPCINGWFYSKDLAEMSIDGLKILGRKDNMFIVGGENYQPEIIEKTIIECPLVENAIIVAVSDEEFGTIPVAFIDWIAAPELPALRAYLSDKIARFQLPKHFLEWPEQSTESLKINRKILAQQAKYILLNDNTITAS